TLPRKVRKYWAVFSRISMEGGEKHCRTRALDCLHWFNLRMGIPNSGTLRKSSARNVTFWATSLLMLGHRIIRTERIPELYSMTQMIISGNLIYLYTMPHTFA